MALQEAGYRVVTAFTGDDAVEKLESAPGLFSAVITNIRMPGSTNGWDVGHRARELLAEVRVL